LTPGVQLRRHTVQRAARLIRAASYPVIRRPKSPFYGAEPQTKFVSTSVVHYRPDCGNSNEQFFLNRTELASARPTRERGLFSEREERYNMGETRGADEGVCKGSDGGKAIRHQLGAESGIMLKEAVMKTQGEIESAVCEGMSRFEQEYMGRGPKDVRCHLIGDLLVIRLKGVLTAAEQHLVKSLTTGNGRDLLKQVRAHLIETARPLMESMIHEITDIKVISLHHDISTATGEEIVIFTLAEAPAFREPKKR
jgi:uncharacterized protein YbcI